MCRYSSCAKKTKIINENNGIEVHWIWYNERKRRKTIKTRDGGVMRLESLINDINEEMYKKIAENRTMSEEEARKTAQMVALSAMKYGDLSNQAAKDYVFDVERFISFEGNTGPYNLYTIVRIKSILAKYAESGKDASQVQDEKTSDTE